ncbi:MAG: histidine phosphatase family protein [Chloroflexi bacterium]|nr:histidine phosphatase family protein [Chloroflexota bacterium]MDA1218550.1 histidine phosphatase family protein [Chloroflexota bacterium]
MGQVYIVRHGETEWNAQGRIQGHSDIPLSDNGRSQAQAVARRLSRVPFSVAYSSDLSRTHETAQIILGDTATPLHTTPQLREYSKGVFEGLTVDEYAHQYPDQFQASLKNDLDFAPTGGESIREATARMARFVDEMLQNHLDETLLLVGHGGSLRSLIVALLALPLEANWKFIMDNCALSLIHTYPNNAVLHRYNDTAHLEDIRIEANQ